MSPSNLISLYRGQRGNGFLVMAHVLVLNLFLVYHGEIYALEIKVICAPFGEAMAKGCHKNLVTRSSRRTEQLERLWSLLPPRVPPCFGPLLRVALLDILEKYVHREGLKQNKFACCLIRKLQFIVLLI